MIELHGFGPAYGLPDGSPFVLKVDAWLRLAGLPFTKVDQIASIRRAPLGKLPWVELDGEIIADSAVIIDRIAARHGVDLDAWLSPAQRAHAWALTGAIEEKLYFLALYYRWQQPAGWAQVRENFFASLPAPARAVLPPLIRRSQLRRLREQGTGLHDEARIHALCRTALAAVNDALEEHPGPYLFGGRASTADATLYGFLAQSCLADIDTPFNTLARSHSALLHYAEGFRERHYSNG